MATQWMTIATAAKYVSASSDLLYQACLRGELQHARLSGRRSIRLKVEWVDQWIEQYASRIQEPEALRDRWANAPDHGSEP
jgi:excisionase family DNA binding protein